MTTRAGVREREDDEHAPCWLEACGVRGGEGGGVDRSAAEDEAHLHRPVRLQVRRAVVHEHVSAKVLRRHKVDLEAVEARVRQHEELGHGLSGAPVLRHRALQRLEDGLRVRKQLVRKLQRDPAEPVAPRSASRISSEAKEDACMKQSD